MLSGNYKTIPSKDMRFSSIGDFWTEAGCTQIRIASMGNADYECLVLIHQILEKQLARKMGVTEMMIEAWDLANEDEDEPGAMEGCPYREAHLVAEGIERAVAVKLGVDWAHYEKTCRAVLANTLPPADPTVHGRESEAYTVKTKGGYHPQTRR